MTVKKIYKSTAGRRTFEVEQYEDLSSGMVSEYKLVITEMLSKQEYDEPRWVEVTWHRIRQHMANFLYKELKERPGKATIKETQWFVSRDNALASADEILDGYMAFKIEVRVEIVIPQ